MTTWLRLPDFDYIKTCFIFDLLFFIVFFSTCTLPLVFSAWWTSGVYFVYVQCIIYKYIIYLYIDEYIKLASKWEYHDRCAAEGWSLPQILIFRYRSWSVKKNCGINGNLLDLIVSFPQNKYWRVVLKG